MKVLILLKVFVSPTRVLFDRLELSTGFVISKVTGRLPTFDSKLGVSLYTIVVPRLLWVGLSSLSFPPATRFRFVVSSTKFVPPSVDTLTEYCVKIKCSFEFCG